MRIGIDIDDTITDTWKCLIPYFSKEFGIPIPILKKSQPYYYCLNNKISKKEYFKRVSPIYNKVLRKVNIRKDAKQYINKLYELGHEIYFITSRGTGYDEQGIQSDFNLTTKFLIDNNIKYNELIVNTYDKGKICSKEKIDILIDDRIKHCISAKKNNIEVILLEHNYNKDDKEFKHAKNWKEIYDYIKDR